jgi:hypothetical protein
LLLLPRRQPRIRCLDETRGYCQRLTCWMLAQQNVGLKCAEFFLQQRFSDSVKSKSYQGKCFIRCCMQTRAVRLTHPIPSAVPLYPCTLIAELKESARVRNAPKRGHVQKVYQ